MIGDFLARDWPGAIALVVIVVVLMMTYLIHRTTRPDKPPL